MRKSNPDPFYAWLNHEGIRALVHDAGRLEPGERLVLIKGLVPGLVEALGIDEFDNFMAELRAKARRFEEARANPGSGHDARQSPGESLGGPTPDGHQHLDGHRNSHRPGGRDAERREEADAWREGERRDGEAE